ncbi:MAG: T9SS type A sorting domain-containing protein [bacterium]|nr:T9SS type A sorting domain-containing protein [bacterium]
MKQIFTVLLLLFLLGAQIATAQVGWLLGTVTYQGIDGRDSVNGAIVHIDFLDIEEGGAREVITADQGQFSFDSLPTGLYSITVRSTGLGFAAEIVEVTELIPTYVTMELTGGEGLGDYQGIFTASRGRVESVLNPVSGMMDYFLDAGDDTHIDYRLSFGAEWYHPPGDSLSRPGSGDLCSVTGTPFTYGDPPMLIVSTLNGCLWRETSDHGGEYGGAHYTLGCVERPLQRLEVSGAVEIRTELQPIIDSVGFLLHSTDDSLSVLLDFGEPWYEPRGGVRRPLSSDWVHVIGGYMWCELSQEARLIVYEINGQFWRQPGDTTGLGAIAVGGIGERYDSPASYFLTDNYPNPFNSTTTIRYHLPTGGRVGLTIFDVTGRVIEQIPDQTCAAGEHSRPWSGSGYPSGVYLYRITFNRDVSAVRRMILLK